jgi:ATP-dependent Lhr-like helicase
MEWLNSGSGLGKGVSLIRGGRDLRRVKIAVDYFSGGRAEEFVFYRSLYKEVRGRRCIIFCNSRNETEEIIAAIKNLSEKYRDTDRFFIHHGSVCASLRTETERKLRESTGPVTAAATATLEMGIDIGKLEKVIQVGPPLSVSAFVQRLGRSGRLRRNPAIYFTSIEENKYSGQPDTAYLINSLPWDLIKTIAVIELYLEEKWIESGDAHPLPYSLFVHQCLSILCSLGAHTRAALRRRLLALPAFSGFSADDFEMLLNQLISLNLAEKTEEGEIIAGTEAGRLASHYSFYSVFNDAAEYRVISGGKEIGFINFIPPEGSCFILGGCYWTVEKTAPREREIIVSQGGPGGRSLWRGSGAELHPRVAAYMRKILVSDREYPYLSSRALQRLRDARAAATDLRLEKEIFIADNFRENAAEDAGSQTFALIPWLGSKAMRTLILIMQNRDHRKYLGIKYMSRENDLAVSITSSLSVPAFRSKLSEILALYKTAESLYSLVDPSHIPLLGKFDPYLPPLALKKQYAQTMLDVDFGFFLENVQK